MNPTTYSMFPQKNVKKIYVTISDLICLISMPAHYFRKLIVLQILDFQNVIFCGLLSIVPHLDPASHQHILCKYIIVYLLKD